MNRLDLINEAYPARRTKAEKDAFAAYVTENYSARIEETADGKNKNLIIGDPAHARVICTAHYDTPAKSLFPNLMIPRNNFLFFLYQFFMVGVILAVSILGGWLIERVTAREEGFFFGFLVLYYLIFYLGFLAFKNEHNKNDNTSGVATVLALAETYACEDVAFILFDNEEGGKRGSKAYFKDHKGKMKDTFLINFDCVGNGENVIFIAQKAAEGREEWETLKSVFTPEGGYTAFFYSSKGSQCNSDHKSFPLGVGCMACRRTKRGFFYTPYIHTPRDTVANGENVDYITARMGAFFDRLKQKEEA